MKTRAIEKRRLGQQVFEVLSSKISQGDYFPGTHLSEYNLCQDLGVSRTPIREALFKLEQKGLVISHPNKGFYISPLSKEIVANNYPIMAALDALALKTSSNLAPADLKKLKSLNQKMKTAQGAARLYQLDLDFHALLISKCENQQLLDLNETIKQQTRIYDGGKHRGLANRDLAVKEHIEIIKALEGKSQTKAAKLLEKHWLGGIKTVITWIDSREKKETPHDQKNT